MSIACANAPASSSSRGIGMTEHDHVIEPVRRAKTRTPSPPTADRAGKVDAQGGDPYAGLTYEEAMAKHTRSINAAGRLIGRPARAHAAMPRTASMTRKLATNREAASFPKSAFLRAGGAAPHQPGPGLPANSPGAGSSGWSSALLFFGFGGGCLLAVWVAWTRRPAGGMIYSNC